MSEPKPDYILNPGQPSLEKRYGEETKRINITLPISMYDFIMDREARHMPASEYIRQLIADDMLRSMSTDSPPDTPTKP